MKMFLTALALSLLCKSAVSQEYAIIFSANSEVISETALSISKDTAVATTGESSEQFDLKNLRWQHEQTGEWVPLEACKKWAAATKLKSERSTAAAPAAVRKFVSWSLDPTFDVTEADSVLTLKSGQVDYTITVQKSSKSVANYYKYARLNSYKKAMTERKLAPFAELKVLDLLEERNVLPGSMRVDIPGIPGAPAIQVDIKPKKDAG